MEAGLDEAVGVPVERRVEGFVGEVAAHVLGEHLAFEVRHRTRLRSRHVRSVTDHEDVRRGLRLHRVLVGGHEVQLVAEPRRTSDVRSAAVERDHHGQVEGDLASVVADQPSAGAVDLARVELRDELDRPSRRASRRARSRRDRLRERTVERRHIGQLDRVADAAFAEVPVGEEAELERSHRALDRHVDDVDDELGRQSNVASAGCSRPHPRACRR